MDGNMISSAGWMQAISSLASEKKIKKAKIPNFIMRRINRAARRGEYFIEIPRDYLSPEQIDVLKSKDYWIEHRPMFGRTIPTMKIHWDDYIEPKPPREVTHDENASQQ